MSSALCEIMLADGTVIGYTRYQGSSDTIYPGYVDQIEDSDDAVWNRNHCPHESVDGWAFSHYGGEGHWPIKLCTICKVVTYRLSPYSIDYGWTIPTPEQAATERAWLEAGWPKKGRPFDV